MLALIAICLLALTVTVHNNPSRGCAGVRVESNVFPEMENLEYSYGFGFRFLFNRRDLINLRGDIGFGEDTRRVYFGLEEAF